MIVGRSAAGRGVVERDFVSAEEPDSNEDDLVLLGWRLDVCAAGFADSGSVTAGFDDRDWEKWAANLEVNEELCALLAGVGSGGGWTLITGSEGRLRYFLVSAPSNIPSRKEENSNSHKYRERRNDKVVRVMLQIGRWKMKRKHTCPYWDPC